MSRARIYLPSKTAMQSGRANTSHWLVEFEPGDRAEPDPLMGWAGSHDTRNQLRLRFETREEAVAFCEREGYDYEIEEAAPPRKPKPKSYADNFRYDRVE